MSKMKALWSRISKTPWAGPRWIIRRLCPSQGLCDWPITWEAYSAIQEISQEVRSKVQISRIKLRWEVLASVLVSIVRDNKARSRESCSNNQDSELETKASSQLKRGVHNSAAETTRQTRAWTNPPTCSTSNNPDSTNTPWPPNLSKWTQATKLAKLI